MLACLPGPGETIQKMRSAQYPTPAQLDAYAEKVANNPLTIKIFPSSVKVPQRNHVRRTVNGLDTSCQRYSPYPCQAKAGLLAIVKVPVKGIVKDFDGSRARLLPEVMSHPARPYIAESTLNLPQTVPQPQSLSRPQALPQPSLPHTQTLQAQQQPSAQGLRHPSGIVQPGSLQHPPGLPRPQTLPHPPTLGHVPTNLLLQQQQQAAPPGMLGNRKMLDADAPPNVTVSTSTIPLSMAASLHQNRPADLSSIVHQINQFCQARASISTTSVCEGQIANPSPISRSLLINASSRASLHNLGPGTLPPCILNSADKTSTPASLAAIVPPSMATANRMAVYGDVKQQQQQQLRTWNQHQLAQLQHAAESSNPGKLPSREGPMGPGYPCKAMNYPQEMCMGQPYSIKPPVDKPTPSPPVNGMPGTVVYTNGHYFQPVWNSILPTPNSDSSGSQDLAMPFHGGPAGSSIDCAPGTHYRAGASSSSQTNLMQTGDYLGGDFQPPCFRDQNLAMMSKMQRPPVGRAPEPSDSRNSHIQHPGYR
ncbi:protein FAM222B isoform X2 [Scleropages formosus]|uniref:protein FAM222B isoform X2 n=1 Tax=Scleropages formosus TaxID=113540 RepID=UPI000878328D|nr:protein FAM222B isoform X2 [Scleropages formosus]